MHLHGCRDQLREKEDIGHIYQGIGVISAEAGEFMCPVCRRLANTLLPAVLLEPVARPPTPPLAAPAQAPPKPLKDFRNSSIEYIRRPRSSTSSEVPETPHRRTSTASDAPPGGGSFSSFGAAFGSFWRNSFASDGLPAGAPELPPPRRSSPATDQTTISAALLAAPPGAAPPALQPSPAGAGGGGGPVEPPPGRPPIAPSGAFENPFQRASQEWDKDPSGGLEGASAGDESGGSGGLRSHPVFGSAETLESGSFELERDEVVPDVLGAAVSEALAMVEERLMQGPEARGGPDAGRTGGGRRAGILVTNLGGKTMIYFPSQHRKLLVAVEKLGWMAWSRW